MKVAVIGAGAVGSSIARELARSGHEVLIIDEKPEAVGRVDAPGASWSVGDACELRVLADAGLDETEVVVAATGDDRVNLVVSLMARSEFGVPRTVGRVNNPRNEWLFDDSWGVDVAVSTPRLMTALVEEAVEIGDVVRVLTMQQAAASISAFTVPSDHAAIGSRVGTVTWPAEAVPVAILRDGQPLAPSRDDVIEADDELFFLVSGDGEDELRELLGSASARGEKQLPWAEDVQDDAFGESIAGEPTGSALQ